MLRQSPNQPVRKTVMTINNINMDDQGKVDIENTIKIYVLLQTHQIHCIHKIIQYLAI